MCYSVMFPAFLFWFLFIPPSLCVSMLTPHPAGDISYHLRFLQARENPRRVYDQAGVLLLKVIACLLYCEHAV